MCCGRGDSHAGFCRGWRGCHESDKKRRDICQLVSAPPSSSAFCSLPAIFPSFTSHAYRSDELYARQIVAAQRRSRKRAAAMRSSSLRCRVRDAAQCTTARRSTPDRCYDDPPVPLAATACSSMKGRG